MRKLIIALVALSVLAVGGSLALAYVLTRDTSTGFGEKVAVIPLQGAIAMSQDSGLFGVQGTTPKGFKEMLKRAEKDSSVKAVVIDINSPGGSVVASDEIARAIEDSDKPTVAWIGEMGASGAYYVATSCDYVVADQAGIVGSIGVISIFPEYSRLMEKIGVNMTVIKGGEFKDFSTGFRPLGDEEKEMMEDIVGEIYDQFIETVANSRGLSKSEVESIAGGRIYTGRRARELNLVDDIGGRDSAIEIAAGMGGIEGKPNYVEYKRSGGFFEEFMSTASVNFGYGFARGIVAATSETSTTKQLLS